MTAKPCASPETALPWWRFGHVWLLIAGPALVVVAGFVTLWLALTRPDPLVAEDYYRQGLEINQTLTPAIAARNHAVTPVRQAPQ